MLMRIVDVLYSVPFTPFVIVLTVLFGRDLLLLFVAIGAVSWLDIARIVRGQTRACDSASSWSPPRSPASGPCASCGGTSCRT